MHGVGAQRICVQPGSVCVVCVCYACVLCVCVCYVCVLCVCYVCVCAMHVCVCYVCVYGLCVCMHGVDAQHICMQRGNVCVCACVCYLCVHLLVDTCCLCARCRYTALMCAVWECVCVLCMCACLRTLAVCVHGVGAQHIYVRCGNVCVCVCGNGSWVGGLGPEVGRRVQVGAPRRCSARMASVPHLCPRSPLECSTAPCGHQPRHKVS